MRVDTLLIEPITAEAFAPFGELVQAASARRVLPINDGTARRFFDVATVDIAGPDGRPQLSFCAAQAQAWPISVQILERHPLGSQAFIPIQPHPYLVVVASSPADQPRVFRVEQGIGINYARGTWHHPLLALMPTDFWILDRGGPGDNCDVETLPQRYVIEKPADAKPN